LAFQRLTTRRQQLGNLRSIINDTGLKARLAATQAHIEPPVALKVEAGVLHQFDGNSKFGIVFLGETLEPARGIDRIADGGQRRRLAIAHLADDRRAGVQADGEPQRLIEFAFESLV